MPYLVAGATKPPVRAIFVGEAPGEDEDAWGSPFIGATGRELFVELEEAGWLAPGEGQTISKKLLFADRGYISWPDAIRYRDAILTKRGLFLTNVCHSRPPGNKIDDFFFSARDAKARSDTPIHGRYPNEAIREGIRLLARDIARLSPAIVICLGGTALWALCGLDGITKWRGSVFVDGRAQPLACTLHQSAVLREWPWRPIVIHDLKRALHAASSPPSRPDYDFTIRPDKQTALDYLRELEDGKRELPLVSDTETSSGHVSCIGFADTSRRAICIPLWNPDEPDGNYWRTAEDEWDIAQACKRVLQTRNVCFHHGLYDMQVIRGDWGFDPNWTDDTMIAQHVAFPGMLGAGLDPVTGAASKKGSSLALSFLASMYCRQYIFWKDDGRLWNPATTDIDQYWRYNCEDCARTFECYEALDQILSEARLLDAYHHQCTTMGPITLRMMQRGLRVDTELRSRQLASVHEQLATLGKRINYIIGQDFNPNSAPQMKSLFYEDLRCPPQWKGRGAERALTCEDEALTKIAALRPELKPLTLAIADYRTLAVLGGKTPGAKKNLLTCRLRADGRAVATANLCGTETFRYAYGPNAFGEGCNLQNILKVKE